MYFSCSLRIHTTTSTWNGPTRKETAWMATEVMQIANLTFHSADISDRRATMILSANWRSPWLTIIPSGMIKADRKVKASGFENVRPYHWMESMKKSNILSWHLIWLVSSSRIRICSVLNSPNIFHTGGPFIECLGIIPFSKIFLTVLFDTLTNNVSFFSNITFI